MATDRATKLYEGKTIASILKEHGQGIIMRADDERANHTDFIPSQILSLDRALGGGFWVGGVHTLWGHKSSGKTTTLLRTIGSAQQMCGNCWSFAVFHDENGEIFKEPKCLKCGKYRDVVAAYINVEGTWDPKWVDAHGVIRSRLMYSVPEYAEQALDISEAILRTGELDILAIDSLAFLTPEKEIEASTSKDLMGAQPRAVAKGIRKFVAAVNMCGNRGRRPTIFFTNQIRMKIGMVFGNPETLPAGLAPGFAAATEVKFSVGKVNTVNADGSKDSEDDDKKKSEIGLKRPVSVDIPFKVEKNKTGVPKLDGFYTLLLASTELKKKGDVDDEHVVMAEAQRFKLIAKNGKGYECCERKFGTLKEIEETCIKDPTFKRTLSSQVLTMLLAG
jgi:RecA/RadA recombinase